MDVDAEVLQSVVERSLGADAVTLGAWSCEQILAGDGQGLGVFRLSGSGRFGHLSPKVVRDLESAAG